MTTSTIKRNDQRIYNQETTWWSTEDDDLKPLRRLAPARMALLEHTCDWQRQRVLDVGCGGGFMSESVAKLGANVTGIDRAHGAIDAARVHARGHGLAIDYDQGSADALPYANDSFDRVICTDVLVHVPHPGRVIREIRRVLKPGGVFFFSAINRNPLATFVMITLGENLLRLVPKGTHDPKTFIKPRELNTLLTSVGLSTRAIEGVGPTGGRQGPIFGKHPNTWVMYQGWATNL